MSARQHALIVLTLVIGCTNEPPTVSTTQEQLSQFTESALTSMRSKNSIRLPNGESDSVYGDYDPSKPIRYKFQAGRASRIVIQIPIKGNRREAYEVFVFDPSSGVVTGVYSLFGP
jgi:hypothetical protein